MKKAIMYGAGNIGRGFIGQLFSLSGYQTTFLDINEAVIDKLKADKSYPVYVTRADNYEETLITNVTGINAKNPEDVAEAIAQADVMATAVGVNVLPYIAKPIAMGIKKRYAQGNKTPLNIIICENKLDANIYLHQLICENLEPQEQDYFNEYFGLIEASIGRMVPATPKEIADKNILAVCVEPYCELPVDKDAFVGEIPYIVNLKPFSPFEFFIHRKLFMHNMSHALTAYLGALKGYTYVYEAELDTEIKLLGLRALLESALALSKTHGVEMETLLEHVEDLLYRFENKLLGDTVARVGKDTIRKLSEHDRMIGAINECKKHGIKPTHICLGLAAGLLFAPADDAQSIEVAACAKNEGVAVALEKYSCLTDPQIVALVELLYNKLAAKTELKEIIGLLQQVKREN